MKRWIAGFLLVVIPISASAQNTYGVESSGRTSAVEQRLQDEKAVMDSGRILMVHRPTYILPLTYSSNPNNEPARDVGDDAYELDHAEVKFQFSLKAPALTDIAGSGADLYFAYTQQSIWQAFDSDNSSPFRDTNYEPEMFITVDTDFPVLGLNNRAISLGVVHQSNGRGNDVLSRSWNRVYAAFLLERGNFGMSVKPWYRFPEDEEEDNNPHMEDYLGYGEVRMAYKLGEMEVAGLFRNNIDFDQNRGAVQVDWTFPLVREIRGYVQYFNGYGECLLDYNHRDERIGIGVMLGDWL